MSNFITTQSLENFINNILDSYIDTIGSVGFGELTSEEMVNKIKESKSIKSTCYQCTIPSKCDSCDERNSGIRKRIEELAKSFDPNGLLSDFEVTTGVAFEVKNQLDKEFIKFLFTLKLISSHHQLFELIDGKIEELGGIGKLLEDDN